MNEVAINKGPIRLKLVHLDDLETLFDWENKPENMIHSTSSGPFSRAYIRQFITQSQDLVLDGQVRFIIYHKLFMNEPLGLVDIYDYNSELEEANIGILIAKNENKQQGIGAVALLSIIQYSFEYLPLGKLKSSIKSTNIPSIRLFEKCGFKHVFTTNGFLEFELYNNA